MNKLLLLLVAVLLVSCTAEESNYMPEVVKPNSLPDNKHTQTQTN